MAAPVVLDTGPLVAFLDRHDPLHAWACACIREFAEPMHTCEAVLSESLHLTEHCDAAGKIVFELLRSGGLSLAFDLDDHRETVSRLLAKYQDVPMSLADACLVRMSELHDRSRVFTVDADFKLYRRHGRQSIPLIYPSR